MSACAACLSIAHLEILTYDLDFLGSKKYKIDSKLTSKPNILMVDNSANVRISKNYKPNKKNRNIARRFHYVRQGQEEDNMLIWIPAEDHLADDLTKTQDSETSLKHVNRSMITFPGFMKSRDPGRVIKYKS